MEPIGKWFSREVNEKKLIEFPTNLLFVKVKVELGYAKYRKVAEDTATDGWLFGA